MKPNDESILAIKISTKSIVDCASHTHADTFKNIDVLLEEYMEKNQLDFQDSMTYEHFIQMSAIANNSVVTFLRKILTDSLTSILYEASLQDDEDDC